LTASKDKSLQKVRLPAQTLRRFSTEVFIRDDVPESSAMQASDVLCTADEWGIASHGVARLRAYHRMIVEKRINPRAQIRVVRSSPAVTVLEADNGLGLITGPEAARLVMDRGRDLGAAWVAVQNSNHFGIAGYYAMQGLDRDLIGIAMTNTPALVSPLWGRGRMLGTNPIAAAFPAREEPPVVIDMATSAVSFGVVENARRNHEALPEMCVASTNGRSSTDPADLFDGGSLLPLGGRRESGGHKGYCLSSLVDLLCGVLPGASWGPFVPPFPADLGDPARIAGKGLGHMFGALWTGAFCDPESFRIRVDEWIRTMRATPAAEGTGGPLIPGDPERAAAAESATLGVAVAESVMDDLEALARELGLSLG
jgi:LDH2 family malate/lactate/ureidoglycolate dehydrogenase